MTGSQGTGRVTTRRTAVAAAGAAGLTAALAACGGSGDGGQQPADDAGVPENGADSGGDTGGEGGGGTELARTSDIPEGGGKVFPEHKVVVTQPTAGEFKAFSSVCTHQGCAVKGVADGTITCPCHNSLFDATDGSVKGGPAKKPLPPAHITVQGGSVMLA